MRPAVRSPEGRPTRAFRMSAPLRTAGRNADKPWWFSLPGVILGPVGLTWVGSTLHFSSSDTLGQDAARAGSFGVEELGHRERTDQARQQAVEERFIGELAGTRRRMGGVHAARRARVGPHGPQCAVHGSAGPSQQLCLGLDGREFQLDFDLLPHQDASRLQSLVPLQSEVRAVDTGASAEGLPLVAPGVLARAL